MDTTTAGRGRESGAGVPLSAATLVRTLVAKAAAHSADLRSQPPAALQEGGGNGKKRVVVVVVVVGVIQRPVRFPPSWVLK